jgi:hypothetical protein
MTSNGSGATAGAARTSPQWEPAPPDTVEQWLSGKSPAEFAAIEQDGRAMYPESLLRRNPKSGNLDEVKVMLRVPTTIEQMRSRMNALDWLHRLAKLDKRPTKEEAEAIWGAEYFDNLDTVFLLELCILDVAPMGDGTHPQYMTAEFLDKMHPRSALHAIFERLNFYQAIEDPRVHTLTEDQFAQTVAAIARHRNLSPLVVIDGRAHGSFVVSMADRLSSLLTPASS